ncbi:hypothetical protein VJ923_05360 [Adlercreutzia sp. R25]|uniref:DUF697 domain-containing protein n=1 Tax=Adlercreutzia shanghongiae TaxID=3111773 RepID=A0ABU6IXE4_9ACTN|nr:MULTISPECIES: hypothetical protein [unclassified Adlercreutzia]MEC4272586.1 hypothetical protein [Adlercreutzia sp. R25]MEC4294513.1 hypothetical protein [Adlercreutzia sp. R22]
MNLPIDIPALLKAATDIDEARNTPLAVSVYIDETAPGDVVGHVRSAFASAGAKTRVTIGYLDENLLADPYGADDMAVIVAGDSPRIGEQAAHFRNAGIPVMVATTLPHAVAEAAEKAGCAIPEGDIVAPDMTDPAPLGDAARALARRITAGTTANDAPSEAAAEAAENAAEAIEGIECALPMETEPASAEPIALDGDAAATMDRRMGEWIIAACKDKRLAFALAFPFVRRPLSLDAVRATSIQNAGIGVVVFIPGADMPIMTLNQAKMLLQIAAAYGQPLSAERIKELAAVVGGAFLFRNIARSAAGVVPVLGWAIKGAVGFVGTEAMGRAAIEYFEAGGDIVGVASVVQKARDEAVEATSKAASTPAGQKVLEAAKGAGLSAFRAVRGKGKSGGARG